MPGQTTMLGGVVQQPGLPPTSPRVPSPQQDVYGNAAPAGGHSQSSSSQQQPSRHSPRALRHRSPHGQLHLERVQQQPQVSKPGGARWVATRSAGQQKWSKSLQTSPSPHSSSLQHCPDARHTPRHSRWSRRHTHWRPTQRPEQHWRWRRQRAPGLAGPRQHVPSIAQTPEQQRPPNSHGSPPPAQPSAPAGTPDRATRADRAALATERSAVRREVAPEVSVLVHASKRPPSIDPSKPQGDVLWCSGQHHNKDGPWFQIMRIFLSYRSHISQAAACNHWTRNAARRSGRDFPRRILRCEPQHERLYLFRTSVFEATRPRTSHSGCWRTTADCAGCFAWTSWS
jgi:hypothetical protein